MKKVLIVILVLAVLAAAACCFVAWDNSRVVNTDYEVSSSKVPEAFDGFKISVVSDFHNGENYKKVISAVERETPDIICITGDLISMYSKDLTNTENLLRGLTAIAPVYYVYGNHEYYYATENGLKSPGLDETFKDYGVKFLNNWSTTLERDGSYLNIVGVKDCIYGDMAGYYEKDAESFLKAMNTKLDKSVFAVLLAHRAQYMEFFSQYGYDLILAGHLHGGEIGIKPIRNYIMRKKVGTDLFSKGMYNLYGTTMIVSGGTSPVPLRILNTPEVVTVTLRSEESHYE